MGVPYLFQWMLKQYPSIFRKKLPAVRVLYVDVNCVFHDCMNQMNNEMNGSKSEYFALVVETLRGLVDLARPSELVYIAVDGVVPAAKMKQQRLRRYKASMEPDSGKPFKNIELSPQMPLMVELEAYIQENMQLSVPMELSSSAEPGEGEHKILRHLRQSGLRNDVCIYGTDGDWLLLTLPIDCRICLIKDHFEAQYFVDMDTLRTLLYKQYTTERSGTYTTERSGTYTTERSGTYTTERSGTYMYSVMQDIVFMSFLFGNDFVPKLYCLSLRFRTARDHAFSVLQVAYKEVGEQLVVDGAVQWESLFKLFFELQKRENELVDATVDMELQYVKRIVGQYRTCEPSKREEFRKEFMLPFRRTITDSKVHQPYIYRLHYYQHHLKCRANIDWTRWELSRIYLQTLDWTLQYYLGNLRDWHHFYPYSISPFVDDLYKLRRDWTPPIWQERNDLSINLQLLYIIPRKSLPLHLQQIARQPAMRKHFPEKLRIETMDRIRVWECEVDTPLPSVEDFASDVRRATGDGIEKFSSLH